MGDGFGASGVVQQVASDLRALFPRLLGDAGLRQAWAYVYPRDAEGGAASRAARGSTTEDSYLGPVILGREDGRRGIA